MKRNISLCVCPRNCNEDYLKSTRQTRLTSGIVIMSLTLQDSIGYNVGVTAIKSPISILFRKPAIDNATQFETYNLRNPENVLDDIGFRFFRSIHRTNHLLCDICKSKVINSIRMTRKWSGILPEMEVVPIYPQCN